MIENCEFFNVVKTEFEHEINNKIYSVCVKQLSVLDGLSLNRDIEKIKYDKDNAETIKLLAEIEELQAKNKKDEEFKKALLKDKQLLKELKRYANTDNIDDACDLLLVKADKLHIETNLLKMKYTMLISDSNGNNIDIKKASIENLSSLGTDLYNKWHNAYTSLNEVQEAEAKNL